MGLLPRLLVAEAVVFAIVFVVGLVLLSQVTGYIRGEIRKDRMLLTTSLAEELDASFSNSISGLSQVASALRQAPSLEDSGQLQRTLDLVQIDSEMFDGGIMIISRDRGILLADQEHGGLLTLDLRTYWPGLWDQQAQAPGVLTEEWRDQSGIPIVAIGVPVMAGPGGGDYVIGLVDSIGSYPAQILSRAVRLGGSGHADIVDKNGVALFTTEREHVLMGSDHQASYRDLLLKGEPTIAELSEEEARADLPGTHLMAYVPLKTLPWAIAVGTTVSDAFASTRELWYGGLGVLGLLTTLAFAATVHVSRRLVQPVKYLSTAAKSVAEGNRDLAIDIPWGGEIGELAESLEKMRLHLQAWGSELEQRVRARTQELQDRNQELRILYEQLQEKEEQLRGLLEKVLVAQEDERKRVSRELHDGLGQALSALAMGLERLERVKPDQLAQLKEQVETLQQLATDTLGDLRRLTIALRPAALDDLGLAPAIRRYAELYLGNAGVEFDVRDGGFGPRLERSLETVIYRVAQEAINNVARHSDATEARVQLESNGNSVSLAVEDNGRGFDPALTSANQGLGLQGMRERVSMAGGKIAIESRPGQGTTVRLEIPLGKPVRDSR